MERKKPYSKIAEMLGTDQPKEIKVNTNGVIVSSVGELNKEKFLKMAVRL